MLDTCSVLAAGSLSGLLWSVLLVLLGLGMVYLGHELGHVVAAKVFGLRLARYYFGFDRVENSQNFAARPVWQRMIVISAGSLMNLLMAVAFATVAYTSGVSYTPCIVGGTASGSPAWQSGLQPGDKVLQIGRYGKPTEHLRFTKDLLSAVMLNGGDREMDLLIRRRDKDETEWMQIRPAEPAQGAQDIARLGVMAPATTRLSDWLPANEFEFDSESDASLQVGDEIVGVDGADLPCDERTGEILAFRLESILARRMTEPLSLKVLREDSGRVTDVTPRSTATIDVELQPRPMRTVGLVLEAGPIVAVRQGSPADKAGFRKGDIIVSYDGEPVGNPITLAQRLLPLAGQEISVKVRRAEGEELIALLVVPQLPTACDAGYGPGSMVALDAIGVAFHMTNVVRAVVSDGPAARAGLRPGDRIVGARFVALDQQAHGENISRFGASYSEPIELGDDLPNWHYVHSIMQSTASGTGLRLIYTRGDVERTMSVDLDPVYSDTWFHASRGLNFSTLVRVRTGQSWWEACMLGMRETKDCLAQLVTVSVRLLTGKLAASNVGGPISIAAAAGSEASAGVARTFILLTFLCVNVAVVNLLPIPGLDGGHLLFLTAEGLRRKPVGKKPQSTIILISLLVFFGVFRILVVPCISQLIRFIGLVRRQRNTR